MHQEWGHEYSNTLNNEHAPLPLYRVQSMYEVRMYMYSSIFTYTFSVVAPYYPSQPDASAFLRAQLLRAYYSSIGTGTGHNAPEIISGYGRTDCGRFFFS